MIVLLFGLGIFAGWLMYALADRLPRWTGHIKRGADTRFWRTPPAVMRLVISSCARQPMRRPAMVEALVAELGSGAFLAVLWQIYGTSPEFSIYSAAYLYLLLIALIDIKYRLVLNVMTYPAILGVLAGHLLAGDQPFVQVLVGGGMAFSIFFLTAQIKPGQLGFGDVKLATLIGVALGFPAILWALILGTGAAGILTIWLLVGKDASKKTQFPYAPFLCFGAVVALLYTPVFMII